ncbi:MAG: hypothetical protein K2X62_15680 [Beijerinckiaceae bacterium]|nr:hypothetical protein [Beijerinckiaceae bacterium]MBX9759465.1 hypothetical protein [Beijerinckiaceae bacterium]
MTFTATLKAAAAVLTLAYTLLLAFGAKAGFPTGLATHSFFPYLSDQPVGEDGYYLMLAAWNLARGEGLTVNFGEVVTGIQPLMTFVLAGVAWLVQAFGGDKFDFARAMIVLGGVNVIVFALLVERITRLALDPSADRDTAGAIAFIGAALSFYLFRTFTYGLETGLYLVLIASLIWASLYMLRDGRPGLPFAAGLGLLIGLCGLGRIDFGVVAAIVFGLLFMRGRLGFAPAVIAGVIALCVTAPWLLWVRSVSGTFMPSSGPAQASLVDWASAYGRADTMILSVAQNVAPWAPIFFEPLAALAATLALLALIVAAMRSSRGERTWAPSSSAILSAWGLGLWVLPFLYFTFFWAAHFYPRYTAPLAILSLVVMGAAVARMPEGVRRAMTAGAFVAFASVNVWAAWKTHHRGGISDGHSVAAGYVARNLPKDSRIGAFQSGVVGFYNDNVINLDGKVNVEALAAIRKKQIEEYLDRARVDYVIDWEGVIDGLMPRAMKSGEWVRCPLPVGNKETVCVMRKSVR